MTLPSHITIVGFGKSGKAVHEFCLQKAIPTTIVDDHPPPLPNAFSTHNFTSENIPPISLCVITPGIPPHHQIYTKISHLPIISEVELSLRLTAHLPLKLIGITGTNGKTTVTSFVTHLLQTAAFSAQSIGNIGVPVIEAFSQKHLPDWFVIELSSFQLLNTFTPALSIGCYLNLAPNHLDWHSSIQEYTLAKERISLITKPHCPCFVHESIALSHKRSNIHIMKNDTISFPESITSAHEKDNYQAAWHIANHLHISPEIVARAWKTFAKPPHRIEHLGTYNGVSYWNDSKSTNVASTIAAVESMKQPTVLIAGGIAKSGSFHEWKKLKTSVTTIIAIGEAKEKIIQELQYSLPVLPAQSLQEAVQIASTLFPTPYSVLLSPGCSSFDMFQNYEDRGRKFQEIVTQYCVTITDVIRGK